MGILGAMLAQGALGGAAGAGQGSAAAGKEWTASLNEQAKQEAIGLREANLAAINNAAAMERTETTEAGANKRLDTSEAGANTRQGADIAARHTEGDANRTVQRESIASMDRYHNASLKIQAAAEGRLASSAEVETAIKQITLGNMKTVQGLQADYAKASPERQSQIREQIQLLTGKDNDQFLPVLVDPLDPSKGYRVFDKKRGAFVEQQKQPEQGNRPPLNSFFGGQKPPPQQKSESGASSQPQSQPSNGRDRDMDMEAKDRQLGALAVSLGSKDANENTRAWIAYSQRLKELKSGS